MDSEERKKAYLASKSIGEVIAPKLIELVKIRNENAKTLGFSNYYDMMMELTELSTDEIHSLLHRLKEIQTKYLPRLRTTLTQPSEKSLALQKMK